MKPNVPGIIFYLQDTGITGSNVVLYRYISELVRDGKFRVAFVVHKSGGLHNSFAEFGKVHVLQNVPVQKNVMQRVTAKMLTRKYHHFEQVHQFVAAFQPDLVYCNSILSVRDLAQLFTNPGVPLLVHVHELRMICEHLKIDIRQADSRVAYYIANSGATNEFLRTHFQVAAERIVTHFPPLPDMKSVGDKAVIANTSGRMVIGSSGSGISRKGVFLFIELAATLKKLFPEMKFSLVWVGNISINRAEIMHDVRVAGVEDVVVFTAEVTNPLEYYKNFNAFVSLSKEESFGLACAEAASLGIPVFGFRGTGGSEELIRETSGLLVNYLDIYAMAQLLAEKFRDPQSLKECGRASIEKVSKYELAAVLPAWIDFVSDVVGRGKNR